MRMSGRVSPLSRNLERDVSMLSPSPERNVPKRFLKLPRPSRKVNYDEAFESAESSAILISPKKNFKPSKRSNPGSNDFSNAFETTHEYDSTFAQNEQTHPRTSFRPKKEVIQNNITFSKAFESTSDYDLTSISTREVVAANFRSKKEVLKKNATFSKAFETTHEHHSMDVDEKPAAKFFRPKNEATKKDTTFSKAYESLQEYSVQVEGNYASKNFRFKKEALKEDATFSGAFETTSDHDTWISQNENVLRAANFRLKKGTIENQPSFSNAFERSTVCEQTSFSFQKPKGRFKPPNQRPKRDKSNKSLESSAVTNLTSNSYIITSSEESPEENNAKKRCNGFKPSCRTNSNNQFSEALVDNEDLANSCTSNDMTVCVENVNSSNGTSSEDIDPAIKFTKSLSAISPILPQRSRKKSEHSSTAQKPCFHENARGKSFKKNQNLFQKEFIQSSKSSNISKSSSITKLAINPAKLKVGEVDVSNDSEYETCDESIFEEVSCYNAEADASASTTDSFNSLATFHSFTQHLTPILNEIANKIEDKNAVIDNESKNNSGQKCEEDSQSISSLESYDDGDDDFDHFRTPRLSKKKMINSFTAHDLSLHLLSKCSRPKKPLPAKMLFESLVPERSTKKSGKENKITGRLKRPAYWVTNKLYNFLMDKLEMEYGPLTKDAAENFVSDLANIVAEAVKCCDIEERCELVDSLKSNMIELCLVKSDFYFYNFILEFLPFEFVDISVPSIIPFTEKLNVSNFKPENLFRKYLN